MDADLEPVSDDLDEPSSRRHWIARGKVTALMAFGLWAAGAGFWRGAIAAIGAGLLCILPGTWRPVNAVAAAMAAVGICVWATGFQISH